MVHVSASIHLSRTATVQIFAAVVNFGVIGYSEIRATTVVTVIYLSKNKRR